VDSVIFMMAMLSLFLVFDVLMNINWDCLVGNHKYVYVGQKHGMVRSKNRKGVIGTQRNMYKCIHCEVNKPIEDSDYVE